MAAPTLEQRMFNNASAFRDGGVRCAEQVKGTEPGTFIAPLPASIVCYAFSAELLLKLLLQVTLGNVPHKHDLKELFDALPESCKTLIRTFYEKKTGKPGSSLDAGLSTLGSAFVDWRYVYEAGALTIDYQFLTSVVASLYAVALDLKSDLNSAATLGKKSYLGPTIDSK